MRNKITVFTTLMLSAIALAGPNSSYRKPLNTISFPVFAQQWVSTDSAKVSVTVDATLPADQLASVQTELMKKLSQLAPGATWHITSLNRNLNASGLLQVHAQAEARLKGQALSDIQAKVKQLSHAGMTYKVEQVSFTPSFAQIQQARMVLRMQVYKNVKQEMTRLRQVFPDGKFTLHKIDFMPPDVSKANGGRVMLATFGGSANAVASSPQVSNRMQLQAQVVVSAKVHSDNMMNGVEGNRMKKSHKPIKL